MSWLKFALRKNFFRCDMHISFPPYYEISQETFLRPLVIDFLQAATMRGLDLICLVSDWLRPGQLAQEVIQQKGIDIIALPGIEMVSDDGLVILSINIKNNIEQRRSFKEICMETYKQGGFSIVVAPPKKFAKKLSNIAHEEWAPVGVEVYNQHFSEFVNYQLEPSYQPFIASGAMSAEELLETRMHTKIDRNWFENVLIKKKSNIS